MNAGKIVHDARNLQSEEDWRAGQTADVIAYIGVEPARSKTDFCEGS